MNKFEQKLWDLTGLSFWCDYVNVIKFPEYNWVNFRLIAIDFEWDKLDNSFNVELGLLGFNMRWQCGLPGTTPQKEDILKRAMDTLEHHEELIKEGKAMSDFETRRGE